jgi:hypothetical protein
MSAVNLGPISMGLARDDEGWKEYTVTYKILTTSFDDGPQTVINAPGLPTIGSTWTFGNDIDDWVWCSAATRIAPHTHHADDGPVATWTLEQTFTNRPRWRCQDNNIENPLLEPPRISGSFVKYVEEKQKGRDGEYFKSSSHELYTGPDVEFDSNRPTISIEITRSTLPLGTISSMVDTVNDANLWGLSPRKIKLSNMSFRRMLYGICTYYYIISYEFDINFKTFDRIVPDVGTREINPWFFANINKETNAIWTVDDTLEKWPYKNSHGQTVILETYTPAKKLKDIPRAFTKITDENGNPLGFHLLDGNGRIFTGADGQTQGTHTLEYYPESNFLLLGIPSSF